MPAEWTNREKLQRAAVLIQEVLDELDCSGHTCDTCKVEVHHNWQEWRLAQELAKLPIKLKRLADNPSLTDFMGRQN